MNPVASLFFSPIFLSISSFSLFSPFSQFLLSPLILWSCYLFNYNRVNPQSKFMNGKWMQIQTKILLSTWLYFLIQQQSCSFLLFFSLSFSPLVPLTSFFSLSIYLSHLSLESEFQILPFFLLILVQWPQIHEPLDLWFKTQNDPLRNPSLFQSQGQDWNTYPYSHDLQPFFLTCSSIVSLSLSLILILFYSYLPLFSSSSSLTISFSLTYLFSSSTLSLSLSLSGWRLKLDPFIRFRHILKWDTRKEWNKKHKWYTYEKRFFFRAILSFFFFLGVYLIIIIILNFFPFFYSSLLFYLFQSLLHSSFFLSTLHDDGIFTSPSFECEIYYNGTWRAQVNQEEINPSFYSINPFDSSSNCCSFSFFFNSFSFLLQFFLFFFSFRFSSLIMKIDSLIKPFFLLLRIQDRFCVKIFNRSKCSSEKKLTWWWSDSDHRLTGRVMEPAVFSDSLLSSLLSFLLSSLLS